MISVFGFGGRARAHVSLLFCLMVLIRNAIEHMKHEHDSVL